MDLQIRNDDPLGAARASNWRSGPVFFLARQLRRLIQRGELLIIDHRGRLHPIGNPDPEFPSVIIRFADARVTLQILRDPALGAGETYMDGRLVVERGEIIDLVTLIKGNVPWEQRGAKKSWLKRSGLKARVDRLNWRSRSRRNVAHHYDLSGRLYELFLDPDRQYSCAYFPHDDVGLDEAQAAKKAHIAAKLHLRPGQRVLDIGCGWGGMALYLNRVADVDVLGVTLSEEQLAVARRRAEEAGVADRVRFELRDYRDVEGPFDRIVSVGMFEHVGPPQYEGFFRKCRDLLTNDGVMLLHTIGRYGSPATTDAWTRKYIFPGGYSPSLSEIIEVSQGTRLMMTDVEVLRVHYALTLEHWYRRANARRAEIEALYDARFFRMWQYYLAGAAAAFRYGGLCNFQIQYARNRWALPLTRNYMIEDEQRLGTESLAPIA
jgi:cyclopropane-fatty-acyl-phospholipid synthase